MSWQPEKALSKVKIEKRDKLTFVAAFVCGLLAHMYMFTNKFPNYDDVTATFGGCGSSYELGRWGLAFLDELRELFLGGMSMPWLNGIFTLAMLSLSAVLVVRLLDIRDVCYAMAVGGILTVFPAVVSLMFFMFTAPYYSIAVLCGSLGVYLAAKKKYGWIAAIGLFCFSVGIYQAYIGWIAGLMILYLLRKSLEERDTFGQMFRKALGFAGMLVAGLALYLILNTLILRCMDITLSSYQGMDSMGRKSVSELWQGLQKSIFLYFDLRIHEYAGITTSKVIRLFLCGYLVWDLFLILQYVFYGKKTKEQWLRKSASVILLFCFPIAVFSIYLVAGARSGVYTLMLYSVSLLFVIPVVLTEHIREGDGPDFSGKLRSLGNMAVFATLIASTFIYIHVANQHYTWMQMDFNRSYSYLTTLVSQIKETENYSDQYPVAFVGDRIEDDSLNQKETAYLDITIGGVDSIVNMYSMYDFISMYCGYQYTAATEEEIMARKEQIQSMPLYPEEGSVQVIDGVVVVKFQELQ